MGKTNLEFIRRNKNLILVSSSLSTGDTIMVPTNVEERIAVNCGIDAEKIPIKDLGNLGKLFYENIPNTNQETLITVVAYYDYNKWWYGWNRIRN